MSGVLVDTNVLIDIITVDPEWSHWSQAQLDSAAERGDVIVNPIIYAELASAFESAEELDRWLYRGAFTRSPLPYEAGWLAAQAFAKYRRSGGNRTSPLPDFYIGAHAAVDNLTLLTRDAARFRTYFPKVTLITPP